MIVVRDTDEDRFEEIASHPNSPARYAQRLMHTLRSKDFSVTFHPLGNTSKQLSRAIGSPMQPFAAVFVGPDELAKGKLTIKVWTHFFTNSIILNYARINTWHTNIRAIKNQTFKHTCTHKHFSAYAHR